VKTDFKILGVDPGTNITGYAVVQINGTKCHLITAGIFDLRKHDSHQEKLKEIYLQLQEVIETYLPREMAIEAPFYGKNVQSMLKLGRAQGVAMAAALAKQIPIREYAPKKVKQAVTGNGNASKEQVAGMLMNLLNIKEEPKLLDATDALAVCLCHYFQGGQEQKGSTSWKAFLAQNPGRIK